MNGEPTLSYKLIIYDLDGTLLDAFEDIQRALNYGLAQCGLPTYSLEKVKTFVGDGIAVLVKRALGPDHGDKFDEVLRHVAGHYRENASGSAQPYPGVKETLREVRGMGLRQAILTNKPHAIAVEACERVGLAELVDRVQGEEKGVPLKPNPEAALRIAREFGVEPMDCMIVGDGRPDVELARAAGMSVIGCAWGMHTREQIEALKPDSVIDRLDELVPALRID